MHEAIEIDFEPFGPTVRDATSVRRAARRVIGALVDAACGFAAATMAMGALASHHSVDSPAPSTPPRRRSARLSKWRAPS